MTREWPKLDFKPWWIEWLDSQPTMATTLSPDVRSFTSLTAEILRATNRLDNHQLPADLREKIEQELVDLEAIRDSTRAQIEVGFQFQKAGQRQSFLAQFSSHRKEEASALWTEYRERLDRLPAVDSRYPSAGGIALMLCDRLLKAQRDENETECRLLEEHIARHHQDTLPVYNFLKELSLQRREIQEWLEGEVSRLQGE